jgi:hypothetical protein
MKTYRISSQNSWLSGPDMQGITAAKKELRLVVASVRRCAGRKTWAHWSDDRTDCTITIGPDKRYSPLWERYCLVEI